MRYTLSSSGDNPISLDTAKAWLKVSHTYEDDLITDILDAALSASEAYTGVSFREQVWSLKASPAEIAAGITITKSPLTDFGGVTITLDDDTTEAVSSDDYYLTVDETTAFLMITDFDVLSSIKDTYNSVEVIFTTGDGLPSHIENAIKMILAFFYENRGDAPSINNNSLPPEAKKLLQLERVLFA